MGTQCTKTIASLRRTDERTGRFSCDFHRKLCLIEVSVSVWCNWSYMFQFGRGWQLSHFSHNPDNALKRLLLFVVRTNGQDDLHAVFTASRVSSRPMCRCVAISYLFQFGREWQLSHFFLLSRQCTKTITSLRRTDERTERFACGFHLQLRLIAANVSVCRNWSLSVLVWERIVYVFINIWTYFRTIKIYYLWKISKYFYKFL
jgi:hypothetical protein